MNGLLESLLVSAVVLLVELAVRAIIRQVKPALLLSAVSAALLIAPSTYARLTWRHRSKARLLQIANPLAIWGTVFLAAGMACAVYLIGDVIYGSPIAGIAAGGTALVTVVLWYGIPLVDRRRVQEAAEGVESGA